MGEFMQQQGDEEQGCSDQRSDPDLARAPIRVYLTKVFAEGQRDQGSDNEPAVMKPDLYARDSSEFDVGAHSRPSLREAMLTSRSHPCARTIRLHGSLRMSRNDPARECGLHVH